MGDRHYLRAGAATAEIHITDEMLPLDGFTQVADPLHVRTIVLESDIRVVIASVELTSLFAPTQNRMIDILCEETGAARENVWLTLTHSFAGPHIWPAPKPGEPDRPRPGHAARTQDEVARCMAMEQAFYDAVKESASGAAADMKDAVAGAASGSCNVNASRDLLTKDGWWLGTDDSLPCDHSIHLLRIDETDGTPIAAIFTYGMRSCVMQRAMNADGGVVISSDLCGWVSRYLEEEYGNGFTALFLCSSAADQEPLLKVNNNEVAADGSCRQVSLGNADAASVLLNAQGHRLGAQVLKTFTGIREFTDVEHLASGSRSFTYQTKRRDPNLSNIKPAREMTFEPEGEKTEEVFALIIGPFNLLGVRPEIDGATAMKISDMFPGEVTSTAVQVNGGGKCMPSREAYEMVKYSSLNSGSMPGAAESLAEAGEALLKELKAEVTE